MRMNAVAEPAPPRASRLKRYAYFAGAGALALLSAYGAGRLQTAERIEVAEHAAASALTVQAREVERTKLEQQRVLELEARRRLGLCLIALDERNFGTAQAHLSAAALLLQRSQPSKAGPMHELGGAIRSFKLVATDNLGPQRQQILDWIKRFDADRPPARP
jgi:hypothetical protein